MAFKVLTGSPVTVGTTPTAVALTTTSTPCGAVYVEAFADNTDIVYVGDSAVLSASKNGHRIDVPIALVTLPGFAIPGSAQPQGNNLASIYTISASAGQKVNVFYEDQ